MLMCVPHTYSRTLEPLEFLIDVNWADLGGTPIITYYTIPNVVTSQ